MNPAKDGRWKLLLAATSDNPVVKEEVEYIQNNQPSLIDILCTLPPEINFYKEKFLNLYTSVSRSIPDEWFLLPLSNESFQCYNTLPQLVGLTAKARHKIWIDVPRTFMAFVTGDAPHASYVELLANPAQTAHLMAVLCRTLSVSATFLEGQYCQGMSFLAASYILYCRAFLFSNVEHECEQHEAYAAAAYHFIALQQHQMAGLYVKENALTEYIEEFEFQLTAPYAPKHTEKRLFETNKVIQKKLLVLYTHLQLHGLDAQFFVVQWFGSCFALNVSADMLSCLQEIFLYSSGRKNTRDLMIRLGVAILYALADDMMKLNDFELLFTFLKTNMLKVTPADVIPVVFMLDIKESLGECARAFDNNPSECRKSSDVSEDPRTTGMCTPPCSVS